MAIPSSEFACIGEEYQLYDSLYHYCDRLKAEIGGGPNLLLWPDSSLDTVHGGFGI